MATPYAHQNSEQMQVSQDGEARRDARVRAAAGCILLTTLAVALVWSHNRLFWVDELLEFYTDSKASAGQIILGQLRAPFSFEPPLFHLLLHGALRLIPSSELGARLVSILSLGVTEASAFLVTRALGRDSRSRDLAALLAMVFPFFLCSIDYAPEARIYSLQLATAAVSVLAYQRIISGKSSREWYAVLGGCTALAVLTHYFGILVVMPLWVAELTRSVQRRALDRPVLATLALGTACVLADFPFAHALSAIRATYYNNGETSWWMVPFTYLWFKYHFAIYPLAFFHLHRTHVLGLASMAAVVLFIFQAFRSAAREQAPVLVALSTLALLPVWNLVLAQVAKAYVPRYSLPAIFGISVLCALCAGGLLHERWLWALVLACYGWGCFYSYGQMRMFRAWKIRMERARLSPGQEAVFQSLEDKHIYVQDTAKYLVLHRYKPMPFIGVHSAACELRWSHRNTDSVIAKNLAKTTDIPFVPYAALHGGVGPRMLLYFDDPNNEWVTRELAVEGAEVRKLGGAFEGQLALVRFKAPPLCESPLQ